MKSPVKVAILGAGSRGNVYMQYALEHPEKMKVVAVAEPRKEYRERMVKVHNIAKENTFNSWQEFVKLNKLCDVAIISTQDGDHTDVAIACAEKKYNILLEKPMAPTPQECDAIVSSAKVNGVIFCVAHVLRYTPYSYKLKEILSSGTIGQMLNIQHLEPIGYWHFAHSYVRGNWRKEKESTFSLMAKCCHDIDWLNYIVDSDCVNISSFGSLNHFKAENKPVNSSDRCMTCNVEADCPYSANRLYLGTFDKSSDAPINVFPEILDIVTPTSRREDLVTALTNGPYGRCVYQCDNDVVDNQVVNLAYGNGVIASFNMVATSEFAERKTRIYGSLGMIEGDTHQIKVTTYIDDKTTIIDAQVGDINGLKGFHGGGDYGLMTAFIDAVITGDESLILSGPNETIKSHQMVFTAEKSRLDNNV